VGIPPAGGAYAPQGGLYMSKSIKGLRPLVSACRQITLTFKHQPTELYAELLSSGIKLPTTDELTKMCDFLRMIDNAAKKAKNGADLRAEKKMRKWYDIPAGRAFINSYRRFSKQ